MYLMGAHNIVSKIQNDVITVLRSLPGTYDQDGKWAEQDPQSIPLMVNVQEAGGSDLELLPEGYKSKRVILIFAEDELKAVSKKDKTKADLILWDGDTFQVEKLKNWQHITGHYEALAVRLDQ